jgi:hypothetical protein
VRRETKGENGKNKQRGEDMLHGCSSVGDTVIGLTPQATAIWQSLMKQANASSKR